MDAVQIAFALLELWETFSRNLPQLDTKTKALTIGHSEAARQLARMLDERVGAREQLAAACAADPSLVARLEAIADAMPFAESLRSVMGAPKPVEELASTLELPAAAVEPVVESAPATQVEPVASDPKS